MLKSSVFSLYLKVLSSSTSLLSCETEFHVFGALTEKAFDDEASDMWGTDSKFLSEECHVCAERSTFIRGWHSLEILRYVKGETRPPDPSSFLLWWTGHLFKVSHPLTGPELANLDIGSVGAKLNMEESVASVRRYQGC